MRFDDIRVIEWENWQNWNQPAAVDAPNDYAWIQVRIGDSTLRAVLTCQNAEFQPIVGINGGYQPKNHSTSFSVKPNPARGRLTISYRLNPDQRAVLRVYNCLGQVERVWQDSHPEKGLRVVNWDLSDGQGRRVTADTYFFQLEAGGKTAKARVVVLSTGF